nr:unnamed protein product [Callosobruchus analis]
MHGVFAMPSEPDWVRSDMRLGNRLFFTTAGGDSEDKSTSPININTAYPRCYLTERPKARKKRRASVYRSRSDVRFGSASIIRNPFGGPEGHFGESNSECCLFCTIWRTRTGARYYGLGKIARDTPELGDVCCPIREMDTGTLYSEQCGCISANYAHVSWFNSNRSAKFVFYRVNQAVDTWKEQKYQYYVQLNSHGLTVAFHQPKTIVYMSIVHVDGEERSSKKKLGQDKPTSLVSISTHLYIRILMAMLHNVNFGNLSHLPYSLDQTASDYQV